MKNWTRKCAIFLAVMSVYPVCGFAAGPESKATGVSGAKPAATEVRLLDETSGPLAQADPAKKDAAAPAGNSQVNVSDAGTVEIHVNEAPLVEVLRMLSLQSQKNIVASKDVRGSVTAHLYGVTMKEALDAILKPNGYGYREKGNFIYVYTQKELAEQEKAERTKSSAVFHLFYTPATNAVQMIKPVLSSEATIAFNAPGKEGLDDKSTGGFSHATEDTIVVTDYADNLERVRQVLKEIDRRPQQVLVEATIVSARLTEDNQFGIDFSIIGGVDFGSLGAAGIKTFGDAASGKVLNTSLTDHGFGAAGTGFTQNMPSNGLRIGIAGNNVAVFINALEAVTDTAVLANPKILTLNRQRGEVIVGKEDGYLTTTVTESTAVQTVEFLKSGTRLVFRPFIGDDGYIRMEVHPEDSDGSVVAGLPSKSTTEVTTNIMVKDGHTAVIGGLFRDSSISSRSQVPGLGNLPVIGALFRQQQDTTAREEIIILLTPHIVKDDRAFSEQSEALLKDMERLRVGVRKGMMPFGRERLAEASYDAAVNEMNKPNPDRSKALWELDCATNLNPTFLEAIKMKERLTGHELSSVDNSTTRGFLKRMIMADVEKHAEADACKPAILLSGPSRATASNDQNSSPAASTESAPASAAAQPSVAAAPTTQPANQASAAKPTTQPAVANSKPADPSELLDEDEEMDDSGVAEQPQEQVVPAQKPADGADNLKKSTVTEVPQDELPGTDDPEQQPEQQDEK